MANMLNSPRQRDTSYCCEWCHHKYGPVDKQQARRRENRRWRKEVQEILDDY